MATPVKDILSAAAESMGRADLAREAEAGSSSSEELSLLLRAFNVIQNEIALDYFPLKAQDNVNVRTGKVPYTQFAEIPVRILRVTLTETGEDVGFEVFPDYVATDVRDLITITYEYAPRNKKLTENAAFDPAISVRLLSYGTASEFLVACGRYNEACVFDRKYREALGAAGRQKKAVTLRARRWA